MAAILVILFDWAYTNKDSHRDLKLHTLIIYASIFYLHTQKVDQYDLFSEIYDHFLKRQKSTILSFLRELHMLWLIKTKSCYLNSFYVPKYQMPSGPYGPIFRNG